MKKISILYHGECPDGFSGAWAAWKKFGKEAEYFPLKHGWPLPEDFRGRELYFIDFTPPTEIVKDLLRKNEKVVFIDHHVTAEETVKLGTDNLFDNGHSGAALAWKYFHPEEKTPKFLLHVEDIDLWKFKLAGTKEVAAYLQLVDFDFKTWSKLAEDLEKPVTRKKYLELGKLVLKLEQKTVASLLEDAEEVEFMGKRALAFNSPVLKSDLGHAAVKKGYAIGIVWAHKEGKIVVSLRSSGKVDVAAIAQKFGGGGHKAAAGFSLSGSSDLPWKPAGISKS